ncbi:hypothetical protein, partial [Streptomyces griseoviridis]|uniref:hypothetical protein n=1 Tax=Streptomyces griseoviridis TaxID=45398 RepID=UPI00345201CA
QGWLCTGTRAVANTLPDGTTPFTGARGLLRRHDAPPLRGGPSPLLRKDLDAPSLRDGALNCSAIQAGIRSANSRKAHQDGWCRGFILLSIEWSCFQI